MTAVFVINSPFGVLALSRSELSSAREAAQHILPVDVPVAHADEDASHVTHLVDANAAARALGVKPSWLLQRAREGRIHHVKLGKYIRFDVERIRAEGEREPW